jgi:hypothetical protein
VRYMMVRLPHCDLHELEGETHFTVMKHLEQIVRKLIEKRWIPGCVAPLTFIRAP